MPGMVIRAEASANLHLRHMKTQEDLERTGDGMKSLSTCQHVAFSVVVNIGIIVNAIQMGMAADLRGAPWDGIWNGCEHFFTTFFLIEMIIKMTVMHSRYFKDEWNVFDFFLVWISVFSAWVQPLVFGGGADISILGLLRLLRLLRMMKLMRVVPQFRIVFDGIGQSLHSMFWVVALGLFIMYMASVACVSVIGRPDSGYSEYDHSQDHITSGAAGEFNNYQYFGTVARAMMSLFNLVVMAELDSIIRPIWEVQSLVALSIICLVFVMTFGFLNILVGMIMDNVMQTVQELAREKEHVIQKKQMELAHELSEIMSELDSDNSDSISRGELLDNLNGMERMQKIVNGLRIPHGFSIEDIYVLLDSDGSGNLERDEFLDGMFRLVFNSRFQRDCVTQLGIGQVKKQLNKIQHTIRHEIQNFNLEVRQEFIALRDTMSMLPVVPLLDQGGSVMSAGTGARPDGAALQRFAKSMSDLTRSCSSRQLSAMKARTASHTSLDEAPLDFASQVLEALAEDGGQDVASVRAESAGTPVEAPAEESTVAALQKSVLLRPAVTVTLPPQLQNGPLPLPASPCQSNAVTGCRPPAVKQTQKSREVVSGALLQL